MGKKTARPAAAPDADQPPAPGKRSKLKLALLALASLLLAGGGFAGWTVFMAPEAAAGGDNAAAGDEAAGDGGHGTMVALALPPEIVAESTYTHSYALSVLIARDCGRVRVGALKAAAEEEARADGVLANLSWEAANRRIGTLDEKSCGYMLNEVAGANAKAQRAVDEKAAAEKGGKAKGRH